MFSFANKKKQELLYTKVTGLAERLSVLEKEKYDPIIGEVYLFQSSLYTGRPYFELPKSKKQSQQIMGKNTWLKFRLSDIKEVCPENNLKIHGFWIKKEDVILYDDIYKAFKLKVETQY